MKMADLLIYLMDLCSRKDDAVHHHQGTVTTFLEKRSLQCESTQSFCQLDLCVSWMYQEDFPEEDTASGLGASEH